MFKSCADASKYILANHFVVIAKRKRVGCYVDIENLRTGHPNPSTTLQNSLSNSSYHFPLRTLIAPLNQLTHPQRINFAHPFQIQTVFHGPI